MTYITRIGIVWGILRVLGAAYPIEKTNIPTRSIKNRLFTVGESIILVYVTLSYYLAGGSIFFIFLQIFAVIACILMMLDTDDRLDMGIIIWSGLTLLIWSFFLFEWYSTVIFILWLSLLGLGYASTMDSLRRNIALLLGSTLIALFSYGEANRIFFWINVLFAGFSLYHTLLFIHHKRKK